MGTKNMTVRWLPYYNILHLTEDLICESNLTEYKTLQKKYTEEYLKLLSASRYNLLS